MYKKAIMLSAIASTLSFAQISVTTTIFPLYDAAKAVGGDKIALTNLIPFGVEAHEFEPKAKEMAKLSKGDIFLTSGEVFEPWSAKVIKSLKIKEKTIDMSTKVKLIRSKAVANDHKEDNGHSHASYDPHYWLSIDNQIAITKEIAMVFTKKDPTNAKTYETNCAQYIEKLSTLKNYYEALNTCKNKKVIVNHDAFGYIANDYGITQYSISGMSPDTKPSAKQVAQLVKIVRNERINTVFFEEFASDKVAKTIAKEANVKTDALRPIENITADENQKNIGYIDIMRANLFKLKKAMDCQ
jgi:zinc transport system substrate-binding protein